jgi:hypothetical protein
MSRLKPKALVVHPDVSFINPTTKLWPSLFRSTCEAVFFGTGFQSSDVLCQGLNRFVERQADAFEIVVVSEQVSNPAGREDPVRRARFLQRNYGYSERDARLFLKHKDQWLSDALGLGLPTIFTFLEFDPYRVKPEWIEVVQAADPYVLGWGEEFVRPTNELEHLHEEVFAFKATDSWHQLLSGRQHSVISMPAFVGRDELCFRRISDRKRDWSVLGTSYSARRAAREVLSREGESMAGAFHARSVAVLDRITGGRIGHPIVRRWAQRGFQAALQRSRASYTCGSGLEYPVRKFFEIPAAGALLVARGFPSLTKLGFRSGENFIAAEPGELGDISGELLRNSLEVVQALASSGQHLVMNCHTEDARAAQLEVVIPRLLDGTFRGSYWEDGRFSLREQGALPTTVESKAHGAS